MTGEKTEDLGGWMVTLCEWLSELGLSWSLISLVLVASFWLLFND